LGLGVLPINVGGMNRQHGLADWRI
jgi:hypothetical protein